MTELRISANIARMAIVSMIDELSKREMNYATMDAIDSLRGALTELEIACLTIDQFMES